MAKKYNNITLKIADNGGYILNYDCEHMGDHDSDLKPQRYEFKSEVFEDSGKAVARMIELVKGDKED